MKESESFEDIDVNLKLDPEASVDSLFESADDIVNVGSSDLISETFGNVEMEDEFASLAGVKTKATAIFEAAMKATQKEEKNAIPSYARAYLKKRKLYEDEEEEIENEESDDDFDAGGDDSGVDFGDLDFTEEESEDSDDDIDEENFEEDFEDPADVARTESIQDEEIMDEELSSIMGTTPTARNTGQGQGQHRLRPYNSQGIRDTAAFSNTSEPSNAFDDRLSSAASFNSGSFIETFDDGLLFVDRKGQSFALAIPDPVEDEWDHDTSPTESLGVILVKGNEETDPELVIEVSIEELDALISALESFKSAGMGMNYQAPAVKGVYEKAQRLKKIKGKKS